jgi:uncharacterized repeat protein (TIGR02543 family)
LLASVLGAMIVSVPVQASAGPSWTAPLQYGSAPCGGTTYSSNYYYPSYYYDGYNYYYYYYYNGQYYVYYPTSYSYNGYYYIYYPGNSSYYKMYGYPPNYSSYMYYGYPYTTTSYTPNPTYQLTLKSNPSGMSMTGSGQYCQGQTASFSVSSTTVSAGNGVRYVFVGWEGDYTGSSPSGQVTMSASKTVTAVYKTQYLLTVNSRPGNGSGSDWYDANTIANVAINPTTYDLAPGTRAMFTGWSGDVNSQSSTAQVHMNGAKTITADFKTQFLLTVNSAYAQPSGSGWYDQGSQASASLSADTIDIANGVRARFTGWGGDASGNSIPATITMNGPKTVTADWKRQYFVSVGSPVGQATGSGWYDEGSTATINVDSPVQQGYGQQYVFQKWVGTKEVTSNHAQVQVDGPISLEAQWNLDQTKLIQTGGAGVVVVAILAAIGAAMGRRGKQPQQPVNRPSWA